MLGDKTNCGGITIGGAGNVFINGKPAARAGDLTTDAWEHKRFGASGMAMRLVSPWRRWRFVAVSLLTLAVVGPADAQQASKESERPCARDGQRPLQSGDFAQSLRFYERATPLVIRDLVPA